MKGDKKNYPTSLIWLLFAIFIAVAFINSAWSDDRVTQSNDQNLQTTGDVNTGGNESFAVGGSDYDLAAGTCRVHQGGLTFAFATFDEFCQGITLIDRGMVSGGIRHICKQSPIGENYDTYDACETELENIISRQALPPPVVDDHLDEEEEWHDEQMQLQADLYDKVAMLEEAANAPPQVIVKEVVPPEIQQQIDDDAARRARARAAGEEVRKGAE